MITQDSTVLAPNKMSKGVWCDTHNDYFPHGCKICNSIPEPSDKELREYEKRYALASREAKYGKMGFNYKAYFRKNEPEPINVWWSKVKHTRWNPHYLGAPWKATTFTKQVQNKN